MSTKSRCKQAVKDVVGDKVPQEFVDRVVDDLVKVRAQAEASGKDFRQMSRDQRQKSLRSIKERQLITAANLEKTTARLNRYKDFIGDAEGKKKGKLLREGLISTLSNTALSREGSGLSVERLGKTFTKKYQQMLMYPMKDGGLFSITKKGALDREISIELFEIRKGGSPGKSGSPEARQVANIINKVQSAMRNDLRRAGMPVRDLDGFIMKQAHDRDKILSIADTPSQSKRAWAEQVLPMLDQERMFSPDKSYDDRIEILGKIADTLIDGRNAKANHLAGASDELITSSNYKQTGKDLLEERVLHFKDGETFFEYNQQFGKKSLFESVGQSIESNGRAVGAISIYGSNPEAAISADIDRIESLIKNDPEAQKGFGDAKNFVEKQLKPQVLGFDLSMTDSLLAKSSAAVRAANNVLMLGKAAIWSVSDLATAASQVSQITGENFIKSQVNVIGDIVKQINPKYRNEITKAMGVYLDDMIALNYTRLGVTDVDDFAPGWSKTIQQYSFMFSGLNWVTNVSRNATAMGISRALGQRSGVSWKSLDGSTKANLETFNIGQKQWDVIRKSVDKDARGDKMITADLIADQDIRENLQSFFDTVAEMGSPEPTARAKARLLRGTDPGTLEGEFFRAIAQFKSFPIFMHDILMKTANSNPDIEALGYRDIFTGNANYKQITNLVISTTLMAYMADTLVGITENKKPKDISDPETWKDAFVRGGSAGLIGDLLLTDHARYGGSRIDALAGPTLGKIFGKQGVLAITDKALQGKNVDKKAFDFFVKNTVPNTFYLKTSLDYLILDDMREALEPGYKSKKEQRRRKENRDKLF